MSYGNTVQVTGNMTRDPELRYTPSGASLCSFGIAYNKRYERNGETIEEVAFFDVTCWGTLAENVAASLGRGDRVVVEGTLDHQTWETDTGEKRSKVEIKADEVSPSLRWASVEVTKNDKPDGAGQAAPRGRSAAPASRGRSGAPAANRSSEEPF